MITCLYHLRPYRHLQPNCQIAVEKWENDNSTYPEQVMITVLLKDTNVDQFRDDYADWYQETFGSSPYYFTVWSFFPSLSDFLQFLHRIDDSENVISICSFEY